MNPNRKLKVKHYSRKREKLRKRLIYLIIFGIILLGCFYQIISVYRNASNLGRVGRLVKVNNRNMHIYTSGNSDIPLVFAGNIGTTVPYTELYPIHSQLSKNHSVTVYDKPGYGWSEITSGSRDIDTIVNEIYTLLHSEAEFKPFIYVAYGMGALEALRYAQLYPEDVAGIVLIDGAAPSFCADFNNIMIVESFLNNILRNTGVLRLTRHSSYVNNLLNLNHELPESLQELNIGIGLEKLWNRNIIAEKLKVPENATTILESEALEENLPIRLITSKANPYGNWPSSQRSMLSLSKNTSQTFIEGSSEYIESQDVPTIVTVIEELITEIHEMNDNY